MAIGDLLSDSIETMRRALERNPLDAVIPAKARPTYVLGLDLGQTHDYSALVLDEIRDAGSVNSGHDIRYLHRWPLRTPYPQIVKEVQALTHRSPLTSEDTIVIDQTGVGRAVVDMFRNASLGVQLVPVTITGGNQTTHQGSEWHVPKRELIGMVTVLLQGGRLRIAASLPEAKTLTQELSTFQMKITLAANDIYGAWREGQNDDTVLATALAAWYGEQAGSAHVWLL